MKRLTIDASVDFIDGGWNLEHKTVLENRLVSLVYKFKTELKAIKGVKGVSMNTHVKQDEQCPCVGSEHYIDCKNYRG